MMKTKRTVPTEAEMLLAHRMTALQSSLVSIQLQAHSLTRQAEAASVELATLFNELCKAPTT